jgi:hypothetical protein
MINCLLKKYEFLDPVCHGEISTFYLNVKLQFLHHLKYYKYIKCKEWVYKLTYIKFCNQNETKCNLKLHSL